VALISITFLPEFWKWMETKASTGMQNSDTNLAIHNTVCQEWRDEFVVTHFELYKELGDVKA
jgi:hypothetical protein